MTHGPDTGSWRDLLGGRQLGIVTVLAGGVALYATNVYLTTSLLPSAVADIGGERFYAWVTTVYLIASVSAATVVSPLLGWAGPRGAYLLAFGAFAAGTLVCAVAPGMQVMLAGRAVQGAAGGLLAGLAYAVINLALPQRLWVRASALTSAMWGVGTFVGPAAGGLFAQFGLWRWAFVTLSLMTVGIAAMVPAMVPAVLTRTETADSEAARRRVPVRSLLVLTAAAGLVAVAGLQSALPAMSGLIVGAAALTVLFVILDRRSDAPVLPRTVFAHNPLKWIYLTIAVLAVASMVETYIPFFGQRLGHLIPLTAGFLGATLAFGWTVGEMISASAHTRAVSRVVTLALAVVAAGLLLAGALQRDGASALEMALWALGFAVTGAGIGMAWPHLAAAAMSVSTDAAESGAAAAAISTVQLIAGAFGAGLAGVLVNLGGSPTRGAHLLFLGFAAITIAGVAVSSRVFRGDSRLEVTDKAGEEAVQAPL
ncbi:MFS transporter [Mycobacteroides franklinii]|uniref:Putative multidrug-efflux transporter n=2 Tax=Mycobacteriaceae TaxID=1762 RepID=A0A4R8QY89_9MYCO|nr:MFS transporter [Mycobacteroides franklinii]TDZ45284.1 putative multidrug-efflux transporter [Mycobacteroides franklinii]TDZ48775.1 putative multidrug-efflux transporter [Mycobacteroides franklinii]TDZ58956.1 putative multidrug-efflux transporter [Mycobacteroides franklinii]TDZ66470.1 putative multidrug-efflux transporter [Mycobacteroides franklinii]TDZ72393.1 putative multidrug-efflux transporter [Mycobacteroides franklinii]